VLTLVDSASLAAEPVVCSNVWSHDLFTTVAFSLIADLRTVSISLGLAETAFNFVHAP